MAVKISVLMSVFNAMEYLPYSLKSIYDFADEIIISDGLIDQFNKNGSIKSDSGSSTDDTLKFVKSFYDPDKKIIFFSRSWKREKNKRQHMVNNATGDYIMTVDSDEVYKEKDLKGIRCVVENNINILSIWLYHYRFCGDFNHYYRWPGAVLQKTYPGCELFGLREMKYPGNKVFKYPFKISKGINIKEWHKHLWIPPERETLCYHYSNVCTNKKAQRKKLIAMGLGHDLTKWDEKQFGTNLSQEQYNEIRNLKFFNGEHPEIMKSHRFYKNPPEWMSKDA